MEAVLQSSGQWNMATANLLSQIVTNAKGRLAQLEQRGRDNEEKAKATTQLELQVAAVEREKALSEAERQQYTEFLSQDHFTKNDFGKLESFYSKSWDRLTQEGKDEMSKRVWGGVREGEYKFSELPDVVKEKEAQQMELVLRRSKDAGISLDAIPANDKADFLDARDKGERKKSYEVLERPGFTENAFNPESRGTVAKSAAIDAAKVLKAEAVRPVEAKPEATATHTMGSTKLDLKDLDGIDAVAANLKPPISERAGAGVAKATR